MCKFLHDMNVLCVLALVKGGLEFMVVHFLWNAFVMILFCCIVDL